ncbi:hypothetical protein NO1_0225 [Candidatus Termititenax aidoneus]|uniref:Uncharacterized protein n=1 Tax=Termititenax aidoneus TaxID=2218524 RepID=A0A388TAL5_TERA1|nr:hypothetical protein NO1_0225 [Candidatus Termititenax aidoneus]
MKHFLICAVTIFLTLAIVGCGKSAQETIVQETIVEKEYYYTDNPNPSNTENSLGYLRYNVFVSDNTGFDNLDFLSSSYEILDHIISSPNNINTSQFVYYYIYTNNKLIINRSTFRANVNAITISYSIFMNNSNTYTPIRTDAYKVNGTSLSYPECPPYIEIDMSKYAMVSLSLTK